MSSDERAPIVALARALERQASPIERAVDAKRRDDTSASAALWVAQWISTVLTADEGTPAGCDAQNPATKRAR